MIIWCFYWTAPQIAHLNWEFTQNTDNIIHTAAGTDLNIYGHVTMEPSDLDNGRDVHITENGYVTVNSTGFTFCLKDIDTCSSGFTLILTVRFHYLLNGTYILSSGGDLQNHKGISLKYENQQLHFIVTTSSNRWVISVNTLLALDTWHKIELSWSRALGSSFYIDGFLVGSVSMSGPSIATMTKPLALGFGYHQQVNLSMTINQMDAFDSPRQNLIINGITSNTCRLLPLFYLLFGVLSNEKYLKSPSLYIS